MRTKKHSHLYVLLFLFLAGVSWLLYSGFTSGNVYFLNVSEALGMTTDKLQQVRLFGTVADDHLARNEKNLELRFLLEDRDDISIRVPVFYRGIVPDAFKPGAEVIVEGAMEAISGSDASLARNFLARTLMTKCPSKYQKENR
ncbi:MAG: cytochrome c maturation protein CcmE [Desulfovibrionaceae bacterium]|nr:cytochrome c maturation protein CcmE [Desulfovibrionaceae bacterium]